MDQNPRHDGGGRSQSAMTASIGDEQKVAPIPKREEVIEVPPCPGIHRTVRRYLPSRRLGNQPRQQMTSHLANPCNLS